MRGLFMGLDLKAPALGPLGTVFGFFYQPLFLPSAFFFCHQERKIYYVQYLAGFVSGDGGCCPQPLAFLCLDFGPHTDHWLIMILWAYHLWKFTWRFDEFWLLVAGRKPHGILEPDVSTRPPHTVLLSSS